MAFLLLLVTFRSIVIPIKAILLNLLSVAAAFGVLTLVFQHGWGEIIGMPHTQGHRVLAAGLPVRDPVRPLDGLPRVHPEPHQGGLGRGIGNDAAVEQGIRGSAGVVTAAAAVMVAVFSIFATLSLIDLQEFGVGLAVAVAIDATLIRGVVLPAAMKLLGKWNWYMPRSLAWVPVLRPRRGPRAARRRRLSRAHPERPDGPPTAGRRRSGALRLGAPHKAYTARVKTVRDPSGSVEALDASALRADFPILAREINGYPLAYLDSAASAQTPRQVLDAMNHVYEHHYANVHRGVYTIAAEATDAYEAARDKVAAFVNARNRRECLFVRNSTEGLNLVAYSYGNANCGPGDVIVCSEMEHHSNMVPWQLLANRTGASLRYIGVTDDGRLDLDQLAAIEREGRVRLVAVVHQSNSLGHAQSRRARSATGRTSATPSSSSTARSRRRTARSTCRRWAATSSRSRATSSRARAAPARCGAARSCSGTCRPS